MKRELTDAAISHLKNQKNAKPNDIISEVSNQLENQVVKGGL